MVHPQDKTNTKHTEAYIFEVLHKDELLENLPCLQIDVTSRKPKGIFTVFVRVLKGGMHEVQATKNTTFRELRFQMAASGNPWMADDPCWLFCGTILESSKPLSHYGIRPRDTLDILLRVQGRVEKNVRKEDPIAVEGEKPISSAQLLKSPTGGATGDGDKRLKRRGTTLNGRNTQQFIEVDAIATDERFFCTVQLALAPEDEEFKPTEKHLNAALRAGPGSGCGVM